MKNQTDKINNPFGNLNVQMFFIARFVRMFAYGFLSVLLVLYLAQMKLSDAKIGLLLTLTLAGAFGALVSGSAAQILQNTGTSVLQSYRVVIFAYAGAGMILGLLFLCLSGEVELPAGNAVPQTAGVRVFMGLHRSKGIVAKLSALFSLDAFAGGFVMQSIVAYWFHIRFGVQPVTLGIIFFSANILAAVARSVGAAVSPSIATMLIGSPLISLPFFIGGGLKIIYDLLLYRGFAANMARTENKKS